MSSFINNMKTTITNKLPNNINELNWIIKYVGQTLFKDTLVKIPENTVVEDDEMKESKIGIGIIMIILDRELFNKNEAGDLLNHLFSESLNKKIGYN